MTMDERSGWTRRNHLARLSRGDPYDLLVIGGGVVGAGVALDAASRGLRVAVVDRADFGSGTSSRSTKLLHGGIRYMPQFRFGLIREGLREQKVLERTADYLFEPKEFVLPLYRDRGFGDVPRILRHPRIIPWAMRLGLWFYDLLGGLRGPRRHHKLTKEQVLQSAPLLKSGTLTGGFAFGDAQTDDARLTTAVIKTAVSRFDAVAVNWASAEAVEVDGSLHHVIRIDDRIGGGSFDVTARTIVAATGAFLPPVPGGGTPPLGIRASKGAHLVTDMATVGVSEDAIVLPETEDGRVLYVIPWQGKAVVGTTDTPYSGPPAHPVADPEEIAYLVRHLEEYLDIDHLEVISTWAGLRALATKGDADTARASRAHKVKEVAPGYWQVAGGKLTGYRVIAREVVDEVARHLDIHRRSHTRTLPLDGAGAAPIEVTARITAAAFSRSYADTLYHRYGGEADEVLEIIAAHPEWRQMLGDDHLTLAEVAYLARYEAAATLLDVALRRTHLAWFTRDHGRGAAPAIAGVMAAELGWSDEERTRQLERFEEDLELEGL